MRFLTPWSALTAAAIAVPLLLLLYFLRLRRQRLRIPSTLLWQKSFEDLQANVPFQRLRWSVLLLLQLLALAALLLAMAQPVLSGDGTDASRLVLLIDRSASMNAAFPAEPTAQGRAGDRPLTRLDHAKHMASEIIDQLGSGARTRQMMIIAFGRTAHVVTTFESNRQALRRAVETIQPTDEQGNLDAALQLAAAFAGGRGEQQEEPPEVLLLSDGGVGRSEDSSGYRLRAGDFCFVQILQDSKSAQDAVANVGIASFSMRRDYEDPSSVQVFARLVNAAAEPVQVSLTLLADGLPVTSVLRSIPAANDEGPGQASLIQTVELAGGAVLELRQNRADALPADDAAWLIVPAPAHPRIAMIHPDGVPHDQFLHDLIEALEPQRLDVISHAAYANLDAQQIDSGALYDLIVFDRISASRLPGAPTLTIGGVPAPLRVVSAAIAGNMSEEARATSTGRPVLSWDRQHPVMRNVSLDSVVYADFDGYELPTGATPLAFGPGGPVVALLRTRGARHVAVGFELIKSNWPLHVSSAVFMQNVIEYLTLADAGKNGLAFAAGEPITVRVEPAATQLRIDGPIQASVSVEPGALTTLPILNRAGLYDVQGATEPHQRLAVGVFSDVESDIRPIRQLSVNAEDAVGTARAQSHSEPLWPWLVAAAFLLLMLEWFVYMRRAAA